METKTKIKFTLLPGLFVVLVATLICLSTIPPPKAHAYQGIPDGAWNGLLQGSNFHVTFLDDDLLVPQSAYYPSPYTMDNIIQDLNVYDSIDYLELSFHTPRLDSRLLTRTTLFEYSNYDFWCTYEDLYNLAFEPDEIPGFTNTAYISISARYLADDFSYHDLNYAFSYGENGSNPLMIDNLGDLFDNALYPVHRFGDYDLLKFSYLSIKVDWQLYNTTLVDNLRFFITFYRDNGLSYSDYLTLSTTYEDSLATPSNVDIVGTLATNINSFLQIEILPNFSFMTLLICAVTIPLTLWLLKSYFGG